jgi:hypothetical protein
VLSSPSDAARPVPSTPTDSANDSDSLPFPPSRVLSAMQHAAERHASHHMPVIPLLAAAEVYVKWLLGQK